MILASGVTCARLGLGSYNAMIMTPVTKANKRILIPLSQS